MNELVSMVVPLQGTLPSWPVAPEPTAVQVLGLLVGIPVLVFVVIALLVKSKDLVRAGRGESADTVDKPLWFGSAPADRAALAGSPAAETAGSSAGRRGAIEAGPEVGGASARW